MELKKYKLGEFVQSYGDGIHGTPEYNESGEYYFINGNNLETGKIVITDNTLRITETEYQKIKRLIVKGKTILVSINGTLGRYAIYNGEKISLGKSACFLNLKDAKDVPFILTVVKAKEFTSYLERIAGQSTIKNVSPTQVINYEFYAPALYENCLKNSTFLLKLDRKIELNRLINQNLEAMAKQLYDYWFVQFDFPDENGRPYKSNGGEMVWNDKLHREIPKGWKDITFNSFINKNKAGDWGDDIPKDGTIKVGCVRGADIIKLNDVPTRYITSKHSDRLLEDGDIVIEVSGGSPIQATGRVALITNGVIERNGGALVCSNFCQSFSMKKRVFSEYFYYLWKNLYDNDNMFNFEGKTSGIKNFQTEVFLANHWFEVPKQLIETFHAVVSQYHLMIDQNIAESNNLIKLRDELLPLLMNGQVSVNSDLSAY